MYPLRAFATGVIAVSGMVLPGCAPPLRPVEPVVDPIELAGPTCHGRGPSVEILFAQRFPCGKGDTCTRVDQRIRNPTGSAVWLLLDEERMFPREVGSVSILRSGRAEAPPPVWEFDGQTSERALRVPPAADVVARHFEYRRPLDQLRVVFLDRLALDDGSDVASLYPHGAVSAAGELDLRGIGGAITHYESTTLRRFTPSARVSAHVGCTLDVRVPVGRQ